MKRATGYTLVALLAAVVLAGTGAFAWLAGTAAGARWLLESVSRRTPLKISAQKVEGRLLDHLRLAGVRVGVQQTETEIETLDLQWHALLLLSGKVAVRELSLAGVRVRDNTPVSGKPPDLTWPRVSGIAARLAGGIERLRVEDLTWRRLNEEPAAVTRISTSITWRDAMLTLGELSVAAASGRLSGRVTAGFQRPSLSLDLNVVPSSPVAGMDRLSLQAGLLPARGHEQMAGSVAVTGAGGSKRRLELGGEVGMTRNSFNLRGVRLTAPGRRGRLGGEGNILLTAREPLIKLRMEADDLNLAPELGMATAIFGELSFEGAPAGYQGRFDLANRGKGWRAARISGAYQGGVHGMGLSSLAGSILGGTLRGGVDVGWKEGLSLNGTLRGRNLDPARLSPQWSGVVNLDLAGNLERSGKAPPRGKLSAALLESRLHGKALTGELRADFAEDNLRIGRLVLRGEGFAINAAGELNRRLAFSARISDFSRLVPETAGEFDAEGWLRLAGGIASGSVSAHGRNLAADGVRVAAAELTARLAEGEEHPLHVSAFLRKVAHGRFQADSVTLEADGTAARHGLDATLRAAGAELRLGLSGGYRQGSWQGEIVRFDGRDRVGAWGLQAPARLALASGGISLSPLVLTGVRAERLTVAGDIGREPFRGFVRAEWEGVDLARLDPWLKDAAVTGSSSGKLQLRLLGEERLDLEGSATATGTVTLEGRRVTVRHGSLNIDWNGDGLRAGVDLDLLEAGRLKGSLASSASGRWAIPGEGEVATEWSGIDPALLRPWLPAALRLEGRLSGKGGGRLLPGRRLDLRGSAALSGGKVRWQREGGEVNADIRRADLVWDWRGETLRGDITLALAEYGQAGGSFLLPLPARLPALLDPRGPVQASLIGQVREMGLLTTLFPGLIRESHGELHLDLRVGGRWEEPLLGGELRLSRAGAYLPTAGIHVREVQLTARPERDAIRITSFRALSGPGHIEGDAVVRLKGWEVAGYRGSVNGERFQAVYLPELQMLATPRLTFEGSAERLAVRGEMRLPELLVTGPPARAPITQSKDVIIEEAPPAKRVPPFALDLQVGVLLGDRVLIKMEGIDAQLGGRIDLSVRSLETIMSSGEIRVVKGRYNAYGIALDIVRGRIFYTGGSIGRPTLDILALRSVGEVRAGVIVGGTPQEPLIKLYSEPPMPDVDILAYIVLGHPLGAGGEQASLVARAAGLLFSAGQSATLQDEIKNRLGLSTLDIQMDGAGTSGLMGYKAIAVAPPGVAPAQPATGLSQAMVTVGKYLTPRLYLSFGRSILTGSNVVRLRYDISRRWELETQTGTESGADLYYKIDFR